jgi:hypothetical protein
LKTVLIHSTTYKPFKWCLRTFAVRATPLLQKMWPWKRNEDEKKSNHASLAQQNGFGSALLQSFWRLVKGIAKHSTWLLLSVSDWSITMIGPGGLLSPTYLQSQHQSYGWSWKERNK